MLLLRSFYLLQVSQVHAQPAAGRGLLASCQCCQFKENLKETTSANSSERRLLSDAISGLIVCGAVKEECGAMFGWPTVDFCPRCLIKLGSS